MAGLNLKEKMLFYDDRTNAIRSSPQTVGWHKCGTTVTWRGILLITVGWSLIIKLQIQLII